MYIDIHSITVGGGLIMKDWKEAYQLAKLELSQSWQGFVFTFCFYMFVLSYLAVSLESYLENDFMGYDFFFLLLFSIAGMWMKPKQFQVQKQTEGFLAAPILLMQLQLPIRQEILIKSRFIIYFFYSFPWQIILLGVYYFITPIQDVLSLVSYIAFCLIWLSANVYIGTVFPISDAGEKGFTTTKLGTALTVVISLFAVFLLFLIIYALSDHGVVYWTIVFAEKWPLVSSIISIIIAYFALQAHQIYMKKVINKVDYV